MLSEFNIHVQSETGRLRALLIHSPDSGIGKVVPSKAQDWLFEDIVHLESLRRNEYDQYLKLLLYAVDPENILGKLGEIGAINYDRAFFKPQHPRFHRSAKVIEIQNLLTEILDTREVRSNIVAAVCAIEGCAYAIQQELMMMESSELAALFISGSSKETGMLFPPVPNLIFTRDIGITIGSHILLSKPAKIARSREALIARYLFFTHPLFAGYRDKILEIPESFHAFLRPGDEQPEKTTLEGGDVMVVSSDHVLIGCSERTSVSGANEAMRLLFARTSVTKVTLIKIPHKRDFMHIDTLFTQVKKNVWVVLGSFANGNDLAVAGNEFGFERKPKDRPAIVQFRKGETLPARSFETLEELLKDVSMTDLKCKEPVKFIYSGNGIFPYDAREQWTDSCNLLALKDGVVVGYDRNNKTVEAFREHGFRIVTVEEILQQFERKEITIEALTDTLILVPSAELSRARGGFHCMSMPLLRD